MSSSSRMCEATPLAKAAAAADARPALKTVASFETPKPAATCCASRAGFSTDPASADPSQSVIARRAWSTTSGGRSSYRVAARTSASARVSLNTQVLQPLHDDREIDGHVDDAEHEAEHPEIAPLDVAAAVVDGVLPGGVRRQHANHAERIREQQRPRDGRDDGILDREGEKQGPQS